MPDAEIAAGFGGPPHRFRTLLMAIGRRHAARAGPTAIAIHDDGDMSRYRRLADVLRQGLE
jgi:hypothetical protein